MTDRLQSEAKIAAATKDKENELAKNGFENQDRENTKNDTNTYMGKCYNINLNFKNDYIEIFL